MKLFYGINGPICRVVDTRSERDEILKEHGGTVRGFFQRSNADHFAEHGETAKEMTMRKYADTLEGRGKVLIVYTDGACSTSDRGIFAGAGVWFRDHPEYNSDVIVGLHDGTPPTNQRAELIAIREALSIARDHSHRVVKIYTDSKYCISLIRNIKWHRLHCFLDDKSMPITNGDVLKEISDLIVKDEIIPVLEHVYGHSGVRGNEAADALAVKARMRAEEQHMDLTN